MSSETVPPRQGSESRVCKVISEPGAACLAYGLGQVDMSERCHVLVLRSGGVGSILTVVLVSGGSYTVLASKDVDMGGDQATEVLVQYLGANRNIKRIF